MLNDLKISYLKFGYKIKIVLLLTNLNKEISLCLCRKWNDWTRQFGTPEKGCLHQLVVRYSLAKPNQMYILEQEQREHSKQ